MQHTCWLIIPATPKLDSMWRNNNDSESSQQRLKYFGTNPQHTQPEMLEKNLQKPRSVLKVNNTTKGLESEI